MAGPGLYGSLYSLSLNRGQFFKVQPVIRDESDEYIMRSEISKLGCRFDCNGYYQKRLL